MTAKKTVKSAKPAAAKSAKGKTSGSSGLLSKIKGALSKKPAAKPAAKKTPAKVQKKPAAPVKAAKPAAKPVAKPAVKPAAKAAVKAVKPVAKKAVAKPVKPAPAPAKAKPVAAPVAKAKAASTPVKVAPQNSRSEARPVAASTPPPPRPLTPPAPIVTKAAPPKAAPPPPPKKKSRPTVYTGALTEEILREMNDDEYMNEAQLDFFRRRLIQMRQEVLQRELDVKERLHEREVFADPADRATAEEEHWLDLRLRERESLLLRKVDDALRRIEAREFGYCEKTGDPIGIPRLLARPTATVCVDVKGQDERVEAQYRDR